MLGSIIKFINYWYFRYLLVTELYMVEKWERVMFHILFLFVFLLAFLFNMTVTVGLISWLKGYLFGSSGVVDSILLHTTSSSHVEI